MNRYFSLIALILFGVISSFAQTNWVVFDTTNSPLPDNRTYKVVEDNNGNIWASTQTGLVKFDGINWTIYDSVPGTNYALKNLFAMAYDHINELLYVSMPGVLIRFDGTSWNTWPHVAYSNENVIDSQGRVWMALYNLGLGVFDGSSFTYYDTINSPIQSHLVFDIEKDQNDNIWILSALSLTKFDGNAWVVYDTSNSPLPSSGIFGIGVDNNNTLWVHGVSTPNGAFIYSFDGTIWTPFDTSICQPIYAYSFIEPDAMNNVWICTYGAGLQMINALQCSTFTDQNSPLPTNYFHDIYITTNQTLWMTSQLNGLIKADLPVGLSEIIIEPNIKIYPNPFSDKITLENFPIGEITILNVLGEIVYSSTITTLGLTEIYLNYLPTGVYVLRSNKGNSKFIKQ